MGILEKKFIESLMKKAEERPTKGLADSWFLLAADSRKIDAMLISYWLAKNQIRTRVPWYVRREYNWNYEASPPKLDWDKIPKAPHDLDRILGDVSFHYSSIEFTEEDSSLLKDGNLTETDTYLAKTAEDLAGKLGECYIVTNDTNLVSRLKEIREERRRKIKLILPSFAERHLSYLLPEMKFELLVPTPIVAELYKIGTGEQKFEGVPFVYVERKAPYTLGETTITADIAREIRSTKGAKSVPSGTKDYGIPIAIVKDTTNESLNDALPRILAGFAKQKLPAVFLPEDEKHFPVFYRFIRGRKVIIEGAKKAYYSSPNEMRWARI